MIRNRLLGTYFTSRPWRAFVMDDFGNAVPLDEEAFDSHLDYLLTGKGEGH